MNHKDVAPPGEAGAGAPTAADRGEPGLLRRLASLRLTLALLALLAVGILVAQRFEEARTWPIVVPLALLAANLLAAIATNGVFRRQTALLVFHLSLVALVLLIAAGRLTYLKGHVGITEGASFDGELAIDERGPWHTGDLDAVQFTNEGFTIDYAPGWQRGATRNTVRWQDGDGHWQQSVIGDQEPLILAGFRFYTTFNKGFAPTFAWQRDGAPTVHGSVQLPSYPLNEFSQAAEWTPPGSRVAVWAMLDIDEVVIDPEASSAFRLPQAYTLVVRVGTDRHEMRPGDTLRLPDGMLTFDGLCGWMGYRVFYDWTLPWLLAAGAVAVVSLGTHFWQKFAAKPWDR
ncbi:MAG: cytochrome c biogenesis protein ResB [Aromatoleum sp.]|uniref:cytochrome c biogenesis protein ResB n=1 Tax=Aromatoleum sp. TaxID=2307007 RepID=UPI0028944C0D|nr:cytochrome c biogenesis protein ResB [Aromatoleum sp.]MDT3670045.1 cytochrome c biogenesis protein ResB [Aromatoleum sp.]